MAPSRPLARTLVVLGALALLAGCGDDGGETTAGSGLAMPTETTGQPETADPTTTAAEAEAEDTEPDDVQTSPAGAGAVDPAVAEAACAGFAGFFPRPVEGDAPEDETAVLATIEDLAADGPEPLRSQAQALLDLQALESDEGWETSEEELAATYEQGLAAAEGLYLWALGACETEQIVWSCIETSGRTTFTAVGEAIEGPDGEGEVVTTTTAPGAATPEEVYADEDVDGELVEVSRTDDHVLVAWVDADGHAVQTMSVVDAGGWRHDGEVTCDDGEDSEEEDGFGSVGGPIEPGG